MSTSIQEALADVKFITNQTAKIQLSIFTLNHEKDRVESQLAETPKIFKTKRLRSNLSKRINSLTNRINIFIELRKKEKKLYANNLYRLPEARI